MLDTLRLVLLLALRNPILWAPGTESLTPEEV